MTLAYFVGRKITGTNADRTGGTWTNLAAGWVFIETDTGNGYYWNGSAWVTLFGPSATISYTNKTLDSTNTISSATSLPTVTVAKGGTGATTAAAGFDALSPMTTAGDVIYGGASGTRTRLGIGTANQVLRTNSGATAPEWASTLSGLTLTAPVISTISNTGTLTLPTSTDTLVGKATTDVFTNKTLTSPVVNTPTIKYTSVAKVNTDSPYSILTTDDFVLLDATSGAITVTLPTAVGVTGKVYTIKRTDILASTNLITVATTSSQTIDSAPSYFLWPGEWMKVESDGANWGVIARSTPTYLFKGSTANRRYVASGSLDFQPVATNSTTSPAANTLWALPLVLPVTTKFDTITFRVSTLGAANGRAGIYRDNGNMYPGVLIFDTGSIDCSTGANNKDTTITAGLQVFSPGLYWLAWECSAATLQIRIPNGVTHFTGIMGQAGDMSTANQAMGYSVAHTFGALPDPYTASATLLTTAPGAAAPIPYIGLRAL